MKIYWTIKSIPELADLSPSDRTALWRRNYWKGYAHLPPWMGVAILFILLGIVQYLTGPGHVLAATNTWLKVALKGIDRRGHCQVGLAGAGRADAESDVVFLNVLQVFDLAWRAAMELALAGNQLRPISW